jgi:hypothetical protein
MYMQNINAYHGSPPAAPRLPQRHHPPPMRLVNPYSNGRGTSHFNHMPNPYAYPTAIATRTEPASVPAMVTAPRPSQPDWRLHRRDEPSFASQEVEPLGEVLREHFSHFTPRNLEQERLGLLKSEEPELPALDWGQWQRDADVSLLTLGQDSYDFGSLAGNSFKPTDEETRVIGATSQHEKKVMKAHEQFIRMLRTHKATEAFAMYDSSYDYQFYRLFQGDKTRAKRNAINNIFLLWSKLFFHRLDGKPYQPSGFMVTLHSLFGELARRGVRYSVTKDFNYRGGFMRTIEQRWSKEKETDDTFAARPTKAKMPEDYAMNIRSAVQQGLLDPESDVKDCQLLFAFVCGSMLCFRGNQVCGGLLIFCLCVCCENLSID